MASTYRGKYPSRLRSIGGLTGQPGVKLVETNDGRKFTVHVRAMRAAGVSESLLKLGTPVESLLVHLPFDAAEARAIAALHMARTVAGPQTIRDELASAIRCPAVLAKAALVHARTARPLRDGGPAGDDEAAARDYADASIIFLRYVAREDGAARVATLCDRARVHLSPDFAKLREAYTAERNAVPAPVYAHAAVAKARRDIAAGRLPDRRAPARLGHGDVIRTRKADGSRVTYAIAFVPDSDMGPPWEEHDGHGIIREVSRREEKRPGERLFGSDERHARLYAYDIALTTLRARLDGWNTGAEYRAALAAKLGRVPTARQIAAEAVEGDFERMRAWTRDEWEWIGICLVEMPRDRTSDDYVTGDFVADAVTSGHGPYNVRASLWGIESDSGADYLDEVARELVHDAR